MLVITITLTVIIAALMTGARVGGWLDVAFNASGCLLCNEGGGLHP